MATKMGGPRSEPHIGRGARKVIGEGVDDRPGLRRIVVAFDEETFAQLREKAVLANTSFAEQVRLHVEWGMEIGA